MLKNILKLEGAQKLTKNEQKKLIGGTKVWCGICQCEGGGTAYACGNLSSTCPDACNNR